MKKIKFLLLYRKQIAVLFFLLLLSSSFSIVLPYLSKLFMDYAFLNRNLSMFFKFSIFGIILFLFSTMVQIISDVVKNKSAIKLKLSLANVSIKKIYSLDFEFLQSKSVGENVYRLSNIEGIVNFLLEQVPGFLADIFKLLIILGIALWVNVTMTVFLVVLSPVFILRSVYLQKKLASVYKKIWEYSALASTKIYESFSRLMIIKVLGLESFQRHIYLRSFITNIRWQIKNFRWTIISSLTNSFFSKIIYGAITLYGGWLIIKGKMTVGSYTAVMLYLTQVGSLIESLCGRFEYFSQEAVSLEKFFEIMDNQPKIKDLPQARMLKNFKGEIEFRGICFGYQKERLVLNGVNFSMPAFSWIAIAGPSGCGKTTFINLIARLYEPWQGEILLDGLSLKMIKLKSLRERLSIVTQQPLLFDVSIKDNIAYGLRGIGDKEVVEAAKIAHVHDYICELPKGYDTLIGEDAYRLSQGLKQRIAIARAIARNPDVLILDEATSSIDSFAEEKIFYSIRQKRRGLSTIIISHRLVSIKNAERIYFFNNGLIDGGTHEELVAVSSAYREFFKNQTNI